MKAEDGIFRFHNETSSEVEIIHRVTDLAFRNARHPDSHEQFIVKARERRVKGV